MELKETIQSGMNYFLALLGLLSVLGIFVGIPTGAVFLATSNKIQDQKAKIRRVIWGIVLIVVPPLLIVVTLISFAMVNTILGGPVAPSV